MRTERRKDNFKTKGRKKNGIRWKSLDQGMSVIIGTIIDLLEIVCIVLQYLRCWCAAFKWRGQELLLGEKDTARLRFEAGLTRAEWAFCWLTPISFCWANPEAAPVRVSNRVIVDFLNSTNALLFLNYLVVSVSNFPCSSDRPPWTLFFLSPMPPTIAPAFQDARAALCLPKSSKVVTKFFSTTLTYSLNRFSVTVSADAAVSNVSTRIVRVASPNFKPFFKK